MTFARKLRDTSLQHKLPQRSPSVEPSPPAGTPGNFRGKKSSPSGLKSNALKTSLGHVDLWAAGRQPSAPLGLSVYATAQTTQTTSHSDGASKMASGRKVSPYTVNRVTTHAGTEHAHRSSTLNNSKEGRTKQGGQERNVATGSNSKSQPEARHAQLAHDAGEIIPRGLLSEQVVVEDLQTYLQRPVPATSTSPQPVLQAGRPSSPVLAPEVVTSTAGTSPSKHGHVHSQSLSPPRDRATMSKGSTDTSQHQLSVAKTNYESIDGRCAIDNAGSGLLSPSDITRSIVSRIRKNVLEQRELVTNGSFWIELGERLEQAEAERGVVSPVVATPPSAMLEVDSSSTDNVEKATVRALSGEISQLWETLMFVNYRDDGPVDSRISFVADDAKHSDVPVVYSVAQVLAKEVREVEAANRKRRRTAGNRYSSQGERSETDSDNDSDNDTRGGHLGHRKTEEDTALGFSSEGHEITAFSFGGSVLSFRQLAAKETMEGFTKPASSADHRAHARYNKLLRDTESSIFVHRAAVVSSNKYFSEQLGEGAPLSVITCRSLLDPSGTPDAAVETGELAKKVPAIIINAVSPTFALDQFRGLKLFQYFRDAGICESLRVFEVNQTGPCGDDDELVNVNFVTEPVLSTLERDAFSKQVARELAVLREQQEGESAAEYGQVGSGHGNTNMATHAYNSSPSRKSSAPSQRLAGNDVLSYHFTDMELFQIFYTQLVLRLYGGFIMTGMRVERHRTVSAAKVGEKDKKKGIGSGGAESTTTTVLEHCLSLASIGWKRTRRPVVYEDPFGVTWVKFEAPGRLLQFLDCRGIFAEVASSVDNESSPARLWGTTEINVHPLTAFGRSVMEFAQEIDIRHTAGAEMALMDLFGRYGKAGYGASRREVLYMQPTPQAIYRSSYKAVKKLAIRSFSAGSLMPHREPTTAVFDFGAIWQKYVATGSDTRGDVSVFDYKKGTNDFLDCVVVDSVLGSGGSGVVLQGRLLASRSHHTLPHDYNVGVKAFIIPDGMAEDAYIVESLPDVAFMTLVNTLVEAGVCEGIRIYSFALSSTPPKGVPQDAMDQCVKGAFKRANANNDNPSAAPKICYLTMDCADGVLGRFVVDDDDYFGGGETMQQEPFDAGDMFQFLYLQLVLRVFLKNYAVMDLILNNQLRGDNLGYKHNTKEVWFEHPANPGTFVVFPAGTRLMCFLDVGQGRQEDVSELFSEGLIGNPVVESCIVDDGLGRFYDNDLLYAENVETRDSMAHRLVQWGASKVVRDVPAAEAALAELFDHMADELTHGHGKGYDVVVDAPAGYAVTGADKRVFRCSKERVGAKVEALYPY